VTLLNLGILAHIDAGKTSLTERLLHDAGVIDEIGSVDAGSTQTDSLALERQRGITIKSAVVSFAVGGTTVNLIDTPGHPDFIAEVERVLSVLDGAVLVVSAVEGVQAQTRVLFRALRRMRLPTLVFVNKIDRGGADGERTLAHLARALTPAMVPMGVVTGAGTKEARFASRTDPARLVDLLSAYDESLLAAYVRDGTVPSGQLATALATQTRKARVHPVFFGSALTGAGVAALTEGITGLLPPAAGDPDGPVSGTVFKVERGPAGEKIAYARMFGGTLRVRDRLPGDQKVTAIGVFERGGARPRTEVGAGRIGKLWGLTGIRIGDPIGVPRTAPAEHFAPPTLETVVVPARAADAGALQVALTQLAEQDPLIDLRLDGPRSEISVSLYGEVQKEVVQATLADGYGLAVTFRETTTICVERPAGTGEAGEVMGQGSPFLATVGLRVEPGPVGSGVVFRLGVELGAMPPAFFAAVEDTVRATLGQGLYGWSVIDCVVTMTRSGYAPRQSHAHGKFDKSMSSTGGDFRGLTPLVVMAALRRAGSVVHEPVSRFRLAIPADTIGVVTPLLARHRAVPLRTAAGPGTYVLEGEVPAAALHGLEQALPSPTRGEGELEAEFAAYRPVVGAPPRRSRTDHNPLDRKEYLLAVQRRV
jgi:ribosomal protection tetracycline resistance protein